MCIACSRPCYSHSALGSRTGRWRDRLCEATSRSMISVFSCEHRARTRAPVLGIYCDARLTEADLGHGKEFKNTSSLLIIKTSTSLTSSVCPKVTGSAFNTPFGKLSLNGLWAVVSSRAGLSLTWVPGPSGSHRSWSRVSIHPMCVECTKTDQRHFQGQIREMRPTQFSEHRILI